METASTPMIVQRFAHGDRNTICEVMHDADSGKRWIRLWFHVNGRWTNYALDQQRASLLLEMLNNCERCLR